MLLEHPAPFLQTLVQLPTQLDPLGGSTLGFLQHNHMVLAVRLNIVPLQTGGFTPPCCGQIKKLQKQGIALPEQRRHAGIVV